MQVSRMWMIIEWLLQQQGCTGTHSCCIHTQLPSLPTLFFKTLTLAPHMAPSNLNLNAVGVAIKFTGLSTFHWAFYNTYKINCTLVIVTVERAADWDVTNKLHHTAKHSINLTILCPGNNGGTVQKNFMGARDCCHHSLTFFYMMQPLNNKTSVSIWIYYLKGSCILFTHAWWKLLLFHNLHFRVSSDQPGPESVLCYMSVETNVCMLCLLAKHRTPIKRTSLWNLHYIFLHREDLVYLVKLDSL